MGFSEEKIMFIDSEKRLKQLSDEAKKNTEELEEAKKNSRFTQVSPKGWERVRAAEG